MRKLIDLGASVLVIDIDEDTGMVVELLGERAVIGIDAIRKLRAGLIDAFPVEAAPVPDDAIPGWQKGKLSAANDEIARLKTSLFDLQIQAAATIEVVTETMRRHPLDTAAIAHAMRCLEEEVNKSPAIPATDSKPLAPGSLVEVPTDPRKVMEIIAAREKLKAENAKLYQEHAEVSTRLAALQAGVAEFADGRNYSGAAGMETLRMLVAASRGNAVPALSAIGGGLLPETCHHEPYSTANAWRPGDIAACAKCNAKLFLNPPARRWEPYAGAGNPAECKHEPIQFLYSEATGPSQTTCSMCGRPIPVGSKLVRTEEQPHWNMCIPCAKKEGFSIPVQMGRAECPLTGPWARKNGVPAWPPSPS